jgi:large subunit ribosomal protein L33
MLLNVAARTSLTKMARENIAKLKCSICKRITHHTKRNKKKLKEKLELRKYCKFCRKNTLHKEVK